MAWVRSWRYFRGLAVVGVLFGLSACGDDQTAKQAEQVVAPTVEVMAVQRRDITPSFQFVGRVEAIESVDILARVEGFIESVDFQAGSDVTRGEVLFQIEKDTYRAEVDGRKADLAAAQANLENAKRQLERANKLIEKGNISTAKVDELTADEKRSEADVQQKQAVLEEAQLNLKYTTITSPIDGRIGRANFTEGNLVNTNSGALANVASLDPIYVKVAVSDRDLLDARREGFADPNKRATPFLRLSDGEAYEYPGEFAFIDNKVDPGTDTIAVRASFPNPGGVLLPDQFVTVIVKREVPVSALVVPQSAVQEDQSGRFVLVVDPENKVQARQIKTGAQQDTDWVVTEGLDEGDTIIVEGLQKVRPGLAVNPVAVPAPVATDG